jgi:predicted outer membrane protein
VNVQHNPWRESCGIIAQMLGAPAAMLITVGILGSIPALAQSNVDRAFLAWAIQIEIQQQDMGRIAERRARAAEVHKLGDYLVARHQQAQQRLEKVANQLKVPLSSKLSAMHLEVQKGFTSIQSDNFDKAFIRHEVGDYRYFLSHFEAAAISGGAVVREYATSEIQRLKEDQANITALAQQER